MKRLYNKNDLGKSFAFAVAFMLVGQVVLSLVFSPFADSQTKQLPPWAFWLMQGLYALFIGSATFVYAALEKADVAKATASNSVPKWAHAGWGCLAVTFLIALMLPVNELLMRFIEKLGLPKPSVDLPMQIVPMIAIACVIPAVTEELLFRGTISMSVKNNKNKLAALAICGGLFAIFHLNPAQTIHQFVLGAFLSLLVFRSGSVWTSVLVHLFNNLLAVVLSFTVGDDAIFVQYWYAFVPVGLLGFAACVFGYLKTTSDGWQTEEDATPMEKKSAICLVAGVAVCVLLWILSLVGVK